MSFFTGNSTRTVASAILARDIDTAKECSSEDDATSVGSGDVPESESSLESPKLDSFAKPSKEKPKKARASRLLSTKPSNNPESCPIEPSLRTVSKALLLLSTPRSQSKKYLKNQVGFRSYETRLAEWEFGFKLWKNKNSVGASAQVFIVVGSYVDARTSLLNRGWVENTDMNSPYFNLKWCTRAKDAQSMSLPNDKTDLGVWRSASHRKNAGKKVGGGVECNDDINDQKYREQEKKGKLELFPGQVVNHFPGAADSLTTKVGLLRSLRRNARWFGFCQDDFFPRCYDLSQECDETSAFENDFEWTMARGVLRSVLSDGGLRPGGVDAESKLRVALRVCKHQIAYEASLRFEHLGSCDDVPLKTQLQDTERKTLHNMASKSKQNDASPVFVPLSPELRQACVSVLQTLDKTNAQQKMEGSNSVWILKPAGKSRGRGIGCVTSLADAWKHIRQGSDGVIEQKRNPWVVQKYIENPLVIHGRKFDIRVWVLVTQTQPLRVWAWRAPYLRFCAEKFELNDVDNVFKHLSNNAVSAQSKHHVTNALGEGNMWRVDTFKTWLRETRGAGKSNEICEWARTIQPQIDAAVVCTLLCAEEGLVDSCNSVCDSSNACALYGYDFVVDDGLKVWLLEVNSSPCMEHSTNVTSELCPNAFEGVFEVLDDDSEMNDFVGTKRNDWELIHAEDYTQSRVHASANMGKGLQVDLTVRGDGSLYTEARERRRKLQSRNSVDSPGPQLAGETGGLPRAPAWEPAWQRLSKAHTRSSQAARVVRVK